MRRYLFPAALAGLLALVVTSLPTEQPGARAVGHASAATAVSTPPRIVSKMIPFPAKRKREMAAYARRHYGIDSYKLDQPHAIVEHVAVASTVQAVYNTFKVDKPDVGLHELPQVCAHFIVAGDGRIYQFVPISIMCRHAIGMNWTAIGIEHTGFKDGDVMNNPRQLRASLSLTNWLRCTLGIKVKDVVGHNEVRSSPYHHERVAKIRNDVHDDMKRAAMTRYRARLSRLACE